MIRHRARRRCARPAALVAVALVAALCSSRGAGRAPPPAGPPAPPGPTNVRGLLASPGNRSVTLEWQPPEGSGGAEYVVTRSKASRSEHGRATVVYRGPATEFTDRELSNGVRYRYTVFTLDVAGITSAGVVVLVVPKAALLARPANGERVEAPVELAWVPTRGASYYNIQIFRLSGGDSVASSSGAKVLSAWPARARFTLGSAWEYEGRAEELRPGVYAWYVWPGLGARARAHYGKPLGRSVFVVTAPKVELP